jgi:hypothetical protein
VLGDGGQAPPPDGPDPDAGEEGSGWTREKLGLVGLAALAAGLGIVVAVLVAAGPREVTETVTATETETKKPTTTTNVTTVETISTNTTTETTDTVTETETVTEAVPPGQEGRGGGQDD